MKDFVKSEGAQHDFAAKALTDAIKRCEKSGVSTEITVQTLLSVGATMVRQLQSFAKHLSADYDAVRAAVELAWSNGQVEGQINRLKTIKRQMYGRAGLDLLGRRFLLAA
jgi:transposase